MSKRAYDILLVILIFSAIVVAILFAISLFNYFSDSGSEPIPPPTQQDPWERIQATGKMVVGTSADYPPFAYYDDAFQLTGFDVALMREIGQQWGVQVEFRDMSFEGLNGAIQLGQIDSAIAAISRNSAREQVVDFSNVYYVSTDATIANQNSTIATITNVTEMAGYRVGVQRGTVYERWLQTALVDTGLMPESNLHTYQLADQIVKDVGDGRIDLGVMDLLPAETAVSTIGSIKIVGSGLNQELYAIAMLKGAATLQVELNKALTQLSNSGRLNQLITQYLGVPPDEILPTPTPNPVTPTPLPTATAVPCINDMKFIADLNLDDDNMQNPPVIPAGQPFTKGWRIQNSGTCTWDQTYKLIYVDGNSPQSQMGGQPTPIVGVVAPGQQYDIYVNFIAPLQPGTYQSFWSMSNPQNSTFGSRIWAGITVPSPLTPTPVATQTPNPSIDFRVDNTHIQEGECVTFNWNVNGANAVYFYKQGEPWEANQVPSSGTQSDCPPRTTTYELLVVWPNGNQEIRQITVYVEESATAPNIARFIVSPNQIELNQCVQIDWWVDGAISNIQIIRDNSVIWDGAPVAGNMQDCPSNTGQVTYGISASGPGGTSRQQQTINVTQPSAPTATPQPNTPTAVPLTPTAQPAIIHSFVVQPEQIEEGQCVTSSWSIGGGANQARLLRNGQVILDNAPFNGTGTDCLNETGNYVYRLEASSGNGGQTAEERTVIVTGAVVTPPIANSSWSLQSYNDGSGAMVALIPGTEITANFTNDQANGNASCNTYTGSYTSNSSGNITISDLAVGQTACGEPLGIMEQESSYMSLLGQVSSYQISGTQLTMMDGNGRVLLQFESVTAVQPIPG